MKTQQKIFLSIALLYFVYKIFSFFFGRTYIETSSIIPGWHTIIEYRVMYSHSFTIVYFLAIAVIYGSERLSFSKFFFRTHAALSTVPLVAMLIGPLYFKSNDYDINKVITEYQVSELLEWYFIISRAVFVVVIIFRQFKSEKMGTTEHCPKSPLS